MPRNNGRGRHRLCLDAVAGALAVFVIAHGSAEAQSSTWSYEAGVAALAASSSTLPFWLANNRFGTVDATSANVIARSGMEYDRRGHSRFAYRMRGRLLARQSDRATVYIHELFGQVTHPQFVVRAGLYEDQYGMVDSLLSLGSMMWSRNTTPMPKIAVFTNGFLPIRGTGGFVSVSGRFGHGWFTREAFVDRALLHEKYFYIRLFSPDAPVRLYGGLIHNVVWGGVHPVAGPLATSAIDFFRVAFAQAGDDLQFEAENSLGNTVAAYDTQVELDLSGLDVSLYREFYIETGAALLFRNAQDGLWGLRLTFDRPAGPFEAVLWEHVNTKKQSRRKGTSDTRGRDTYYNNALYRDGWTYRGRTIGVPLIRTDGIRPGVTNNLLVAHHLGVAGRLGRSMPFLLLATFSRNYGAGNICRDPSCLMSTSELTGRRDQVSLLAQLSGRLRSPENLYLEAALATDVGRFSRDTFGASIGVRWQGTIGRR